jgi:hypothetical protein
MGVPSVPALGLPPVPGELPPFALHSGKAGWGLMQLPERQSSCAHVWPTLPQAAATTPHASAPRANAARKRDRMITSRPYERSVPESR